MTIATIALSLLAAVPVFEGFEAKRYQQHDAIIAKCVREFNRHRGAWADANRDQARTIPNITEAMVKAHMIQETGGGDKRSLAAWNGDPLQVNVPGDWGDEKKLIGLSKPRNRNEGGAELNIRAAIKYLVRKGFSTSGKPVRVLRQDEFGGWPTALRNYNGRTVRTSSGKKYNAEYADRIIERATDRDRHVAIEIKLRK